MTAVTCEAPHAMNNFRAEKTRSALARIGCVALNLLQPGLGLLRVGSGRAGSLLIAAPLLWVWLSIALFAVARRPSFVAIAIYAAAALSGMVVLYISAMVLTWRRGAVKAASPPWWTRWYALVGLLSVTGAAANISVPLAHRFYKPFYIPSEAMAPTLGRFDRIVADMRGGRHPAVGDIVLIATGGTTFIKRVVALSGDRIAITTDLPTVNGIRALAVAAGGTRFLGPHGWESAQLIHERIPGESAFHDIAVGQRTEYGDMAERVIPPGHVFVLGDNRERSADSRLSPDEGGLGMVAIETIVGQPLYVTWPHATGRIGRPAGR